MTELLPEIRNAVRALILREDQVLMLLKQGYPDGERFALPGGGQDTGETLIEALRRECLEEINAAPEVGELLLVADFFKQRDTEPPSQRHVIEFLFLCSLPDDYQPCNGSHPDKHQAAVVWRPLDALSELPVFPGFLGDSIVLALQGASSRYLDSGTRR